MATRSSEAYLDISNLVDVLDKLNECGFQKTKWEELGLRLGLLKDTLEAIEMKHRGDVDRCITECLSQWLRRVDNVDSRGGAKWDSLSNALQSMNMTAVAEKLSKYFRTPEVNVVPETSKDLRIVPQDTRSVSARFNEMEEEIKGLRMKVDYLASLSNNACSAREEFYRYTVLLIGETGSGKTSFLNLLYNSKLIEELGTQVDGAKISQIKHYNDLKIESSSERAMESKTSEAKFYETEVCKMKMMVIDTPGFRDFRGLGKDKENVQKIIDALKQQDYINCVCLIINGRQCRMSASLKYILSEISTTLPKEIFDNIIVIFTYTADLLDCNFNIAELENYFRKKIKHYFFIENPYCRIEKAKQKVTQLSVYQIAKSLMKSFEDTAECLHSIYDTIKDFKNVHTLHFIKLYDKKQEIEKDIIKIQEVDAELKLEQAWPMKERADVPRLGLQKKRQHLLRIKNGLLMQLNDKITEFQELSISPQNYAIVIEKQYDVVRLQIEVAIGDERAQLNALKVDLEKKLEIVNLALKQLPCI